MKLTRSGARRHRGTTTVINKETKAPRFDSKSRCVTLEARDQDPVNRSTYDYHLYLSIDELGRAVELLADKLPAADRALVATALRHHTRSLLRLANLSAGVPLDNATTT
jgi:hypothetical protein